MPLTAALSALAEPTPAFPDATDAEVVSRIVGGDVEMFEVIVRRYNPRLFRVGMAYLGNHAQTEDCMQNAYVKAFLNLRRFRGGSSFATWLTRIMINECLMVLRRQRKLFMETLESKERAEPEAFAVPAEDPLVTQELRSVLETAVQQLPRSHRAVYLLREVQQLSTAETAQCLRISEQNVKVCLHRARAGLKTRLMQSAAGVELFAYPARYCDPLTQRVMERVRGAIAAVRAGRESC